MFGHVGKRLGKKAKVILRIHDVLNWETNYYKTRIVCPIYQEVMAIKQ